MNTLIATGVLWVNGNNDAEEAEGVDADGGRDGDCTSDDGCGLVAGDDECGLWLVENSARMTKPKEPVPVI